MFAHAIGPDRLLQALNNCQPLLPAELGQGQSIKENKEFSWRHLNSRLVAVGVVAVGVAVQGRDRIRACRVVGCWNNYDRQSANPETAVIRPERNLVIQFSSPREEEIDIH